MTRLPKQILFPVLGMVLLCIACVSCSTMPTVAPYNASYWGNDELNAAACSGSVFYPRGALGTLFACLRFQELEKLIEAQCQQQWGLKGAEDLATLPHPDFQVGIAPKNLPMARSWPVHTMKFSMPYVRPLRIDCVRVTLSQIQPIHPAFHAQFHGDPAASAKDASRYIRWGVSPGFRP